MSDAFTYLRRAFLNHWNLLGLGGATAFSLLSGRPDVVLPVTLAAEVAWLAALTTSARFQRHVDATERNRPSSGERSPLGESALRILNALPPPERRRFERLRHLCRELVDVADVAALAPAQQPAILHDVRRENIDRLLWIFLKLLHSRTALDRFFATTSEEEIRAHKEDAQRKLRQLDPAGSETLERARQRAALEDIVATSELRLQNFRKARENREFLQLEIDRLDAKIAGIAEMGINRQDPRALTSEIDVVSTSAVETERALHEIAAITGLDFSDEREAPRLLAGSVTARRS